MAKTKHPIRLNQPERDYLQKVYDGSYPKTKRHRAAILLRADENRPGGGLNDRQIAEALECSLRGIQRIRRTASEKGLRHCIEGHYGCKVQVHS